MKATQRMGVWVAAALLGSSWVTGATAQPTPRVLRPVPGPVVPPPAYRRALAEGTRSPDGSPGAAYWRNHASYVIRAELDPATGLITGSETIRYENRSQDPLSVLALHLYLNIHK